MEGLPSESKIGSCQAYECAEQLVASLNLSHTYLACATVHERFSLFCRGRKPKGNKFLLQDIYHAENVEEPKKMYTHPQESTKTWVCRSVYEYYSAHNTKTHEQSWC